MEVKELRDLIKVIHDSGDCGQTLSDVLEMANKICEQPSDLEIVQKALIEKFGGSGCLVFHHGGWVIETDEYVIAEGNDNESLLTWAKQQIGVE